MFPTVLEFTLPWLGSVRVASYGLLVAAGYVVGILWLRRHRERLGVDDDRFWSIVYWLFAGVILGSKALFVALNWRAYASGEMGLLRDFRYGFVFFGGLLGAMAVGLVLARRWKIPFLAAADHFAVALPLGHAVGRLGCLAAGCCYGLPTTLPWGVRFTDPVCLVPEDLRGIALHPTQLYEALGLAAVAAAARAALPLVWCGRLKPGSVLALYWLLYSVLRFAVEFLRGDDRGGSWLSLSPSQWISLAGGAAAALLLARLAPGGRPPAGARA